LPETSKSEDVRSRLQFDTLDEKVASNIRSVEGIKDVATGDITVKSFEMNDQDTGGNTILEWPLAILLVILVLLAILVAVIIVMVRKKTTRSVFTARKAPASDGTEELTENPVPLSDSPTEHDALLGDGMNGNEESAVPTEEHEERPEDFVAGSGEAEEEEVPVGGYSQPPAAAAAPADDEEDAEMKAAIARSLQDGQHGSDDLNNPFASEKD